MHILAKTLRSPVQVELVVSGRGLEERWATMGASNHDWAGGLIGDLLLAKSRGGASRVRQTHERRSLPERVETSRADAGVDRQGCQKSSCCRLSLAHSMYYHQAALAMFVPWLGVRAVWRRGLASGERTCPSGRRWGYS